MTLFDDHENSGRPPGPFGSRPDGGGLPPVPFRLIGIAAALVLAFTATSVLKSIYVDYLWFDSVGLESVYSTRIFAQVILFLIGTALAAIVFGASIWLARRAAPGGLDQLFGRELAARGLGRSVGIGVAAAIGRTINGMLAAAVFVVALIFGSIAAGNWETLLRWTNGVPFGAADPQFGRDIGFFIFDLPAYRFIHSWLTGLAVVSALGAVAVYGLTFSLQRLGFMITRSIRIHLSVAAGAVVLLIAAGIYLGVFDLVTSSQGLVYGAMYTDVHARLPARYALAALAGLVGVAIIVNAFVMRSGFRIPLAAFALWVVASIAGGALYPWFVQSFQVAPNEIRLEAPYVLRNIQATRAAWGLDRIDATTHPANPVVTPEEVTLNPETLDNIRILDPEPLTPTLNELQALRPLYRFAGIDISRYPLNASAPGTGADQQVLLSARELDLARVVDRNWTRDRLQLTHGFGAIATPVTEVEQEGLPRLALRDIPPSTAYERLALTEDGARIYFGELTSHYVIVNSLEPEFDYPDPQAEGRDVRTSYMHERGIALSSLVRRLLLAWDLGDLNLLISGQLQDESRLLMERQIQNRVAKIAPFLDLDSDPYLMIVDGQLQWMLPAYTVTNRYPYSQPAAAVNYIRNSVQIVMDATTGDMNFYIVDEGDPIIQAWERIFPDLFTSQDEMPDAVRQQLRYPLDMFRLQTQLYRRYHVTDVEVFFTGEDFWELPIQRARGQARPMEPYYVTIRLPGEDRVEFVLIMPFTPRDRETPSRGSPAAPTASISGRCKTSGSRRVCWFSGRLRSKTASNRTPRSRNS